MHSQFKFCYFVGAYPPYMAHSLFRRKSVASVMDPSGETDPKVVRRGIGNGSVGIEIANHGVAAGIAGGVRALGHHDAIDLPGNQIPDLA